MLRDHRRTAPDLALRALGAILLLIGALLLSHMGRMVRLPPPHDGSVAEMACAALGFLALSAGGALAALGAHVFDQVAISERWVGRPGHPFARTVADGDEAIP